MIVQDGGQYSTTVLMTLMALEKYYDLKLDILSQIESLCVHTVPRCSRALMLAAEYLALAAQGKGGLRNGPAANSAFTHVFDQIKAEPNGVQVRELFRIVREQWLRSETEMIRAARHLEAAAQIYTRLEVEEICHRYIPDISIGIDHQRPRSVIVEAAARIDLFGGWLDTPPITFNARPSAVVNMAIRVDGVKPITCQVSCCSNPGITVKTDETAISFESSRSILHSHNKPGDPGALVCACLMCIGIPKRPDDKLSEVLQISFSSTGLEIKCHSSLPHGSGLGTSSILAAAVIRALWLLAGVNPSEKSVCHAVLMVEQLLTTGGGWQDQVGCLYPGIKKGSNSRLVFWRPTRNVIASLENNVCLFSDSIRTGHMPCDLIDLYYQAKKALATGCEPETVTSLIFRLKTANLIETAWLAGAGGGGFLYVWLREGVTVDHIRTSVADGGSTEIRRGGGGAVLTLGESTDSPPLPARRADWGLGKSNDREARLEVEKKEAEEMTFAVTHAFRAEVEEEISSLIEECHIEKKLSDLKVLSEHCKAMNEELDATGGYRALGPKQDLEGTLHAVATAYHHSLSSVLEKLKKDIETATETLRQAKQQVEESAEIAESMMKDRAKSQCNLSVPADVSFVLKTTLESSS
ncbi:hypothetical protein KIN20_023680 [Parelaphostrongylus tenuis]|uniref:GHMP kinase N-terminal domain-containing protein n=1 Tax=Parelaphostrongylus tenuis TaxID=148309 RepID=A0AAD5N9B2_PARTN|nr:hypothetical protein KIN20_023680 [Parelaphostrongylus tenuis]